MTRARARSFSASSVGPRPTQSLARDCQESYVRGLLDHRAVTNLSLNMMAN
jgi:hypothetical protein